MQTIRKSIYIGLGGKSTLLPTIGVPLYIWFIERAYIFYIISVLPEVLHATNQEIGKIVELVILQVYIFTVARQCRAGPGHKVWSWICKEEKIIHPPFPCRIQCRQQHTRQNCDDRNHDEQFNQCKCNFYTRSYNTMKKSDFTFAKTIYDALEINWNIFNFHHQEN